VSARDQLIVALRGGEDGDWPQHGWEEAEEMADRILAVHATEVLREAAARIRRAAEAIVGDDPRWNGWNAAADLIDPDAGGEEPPPVREMTPEETARILPRVAVEGVETPGCDCGHAGMGRNWHRDDCAWREGRR
jgi:hypothetical protein